MKKSLAVVLLIALFGSTVSAEQTVVQLKVLVDNSLTLTSTVSPVVTLTTLDTTIGSVTVASNGAAWKLAVLSSNGGYLKPAESVAGMYYPYTLTVGTVAEINLADTVNNPGHTYTVTGTAASATFPLSVQFASTPAALGLAAGTYIDQLYITLSAN